MGLDKILLPLVQGLPVLHLNYFASFLPIKSEIRSMFKIRVSKHNRKIIEAKYFGP